MAAIQKTSLIPSDRYVAVTAAGPVHCRLQARSNGVRIIVAQALPTRESKDYFVMRYGDASANIVLPTLEAGDIVYARSDRTPTNLTVLSDKAVVSVV